MLQDLPRSTRFTHLCTAPNSSCSQMSTIFLAKCCQHHVTKFDEFLLKCWQYVGQMMPNFTKIQRIYWSLTNSANVTVEFVKILSIFSQSLQMLAKTFAFVCQCAELLSMFNFFWNTTAPTPSSEPSRNPATPAGNVSRHGGDGGAVVLEFRSFSEGISLVFGCIGADLCK